MGTDCPQSQLFWCPFGGEDCRNIKKPCIILQTKLNVTVSGQRFGFDLINKVPIPSMNVQDPTLAEILSEYFARNT